MGASELGVHDVPVTVVTGELGVGKTTAIRHLFAHHRPEGERWAVLVNEFGEVGLDGAVLGADGSGSGGKGEGGLAVREVPGGCICCSAGLSLRMALVRLLREVRPHRLLIEPTGLAHPAAVLDHLRQPGLREAVSLRATITLVDPRRFADPAVRSRDVYADQVLAADVLVANRSDLYDAATLEAFYAEAGRLFPAPLVVAATEGAVLEPAWLDLRPSPERQERRAHVHTAPTFADLRPAGERPLAPPLAPVEPHVASDHASRGWIFPPSVAFDRHRLEDALQELVRPNPALPAGVARLKGIFRTPRVWLKVDATPDLLRWEALNYRRDSRVELIVPAAPAPDWDAVEARLREAIWVRQRDS